jgi:hypothetical protein
MKSINVWRTWSKDVQGSQVFLPNIIIPFFGSITYIKELSVISLNFHDTSTFRTHFCNKHSLFCHAGSYFPDQSCQTKPWALLYASVPTSEQIVLHKQGKHESQSSWSLLIDHIYVNPKWHVIYLVMTLWFWHCVELQVDVNTATFFMMTVVYSRCCYDSEKDVGRYCRRVSFRASAPFITVIHNFTISWLLLTQCKVH